MGVPPTPPSTLFEGPRVFVPERSLQRAQAEGSQARVVLAQRAWEEEQDLVWVEVLVWLFGFGFRFFLGLALRFRRPFFWRC